MTQENVNASDFAKMLVGAKKSSNQMYTLTNDDAEIINGLRLLPGNRDVKPKRIPSIVDAISKGIYMPPIIVSLPYRYVTDGNNRIVAYKECMRLGIPFSMEVYFYKDEQPLKTCRIINNNQKSWTLNERFHSFCFEKETNYLELKRFMSTHSKIFNKKNNWQLSAALDLLFPSRVKAEQLFKNGNLPELTTEVLSSANQILDELKLLSEIFGSLSVFQRDHISAWKSARVRLGLSWDSYIAKTTRSVKKNGWKEPADFKKDWFDMYMHLAGL